MVDRMRVGPGTAHWKKFAFGMPPGIKKPPFPLDIGGRE